MKISAIVAVSRGNVIGKDNGIPWYLPADFKYFKKLAPSGDFDIINPNTESRRV